jgi:hypothetical protein
MTLAALEQIARILGWLILAIGGGALCIGIISAILLWSYTATLRAFGKERRVWFDILCEMQRQGKLRWQGKRE